MDKYKEIPVSAAKRIAEEFDKDQVIIVTWDGAHDMQHVTTYGKNKRSSIQAAQGGNFVKATLGWPDMLCHSVPDWWLKERGKLLNACKLAIVEMTNTDAAIEAQAKAEGKLGSYNPWFVDVIRELRTVIDEVERPDKSA